VPDSAATAGWSQYTIASLFLMCCSKSLLTAMLISAPFLLI